MIGVSLQFDLRRDFRFKDISVLIVVVAHVLLGTAPQDSKKLGNSVAPRVLTRQETEFKSLGHGTTARPKNHGYGSGMHWDSSRFLISKHP